MISLLWHLTHSYLDIQQSQLPGMGLLVCGSPRPDSAAEQMDPPEWAELHAARLASC